MRKNKPFISRAMFLTNIKQYCELNNIDFEKEILNNPTNQYLINYAFLQGTLIGRKGNKTFQDGTECVNNY